MGGVRLQSCYGTLFFLLQSLSWVIICTRSNPLLGGRGHCLTSLLPLLKSAMFGLLVDGITGGQMVRWPYNDHSVSHRFCSGVACPFLKAISLKAAVRAKPMSVLTRVIVLHEFSFNKTCDPACRWRLFCIRVSRVRPRAVCYMFIPVALVMGVNTKVTKGWNMNALLQKYC